ncbi:MAG: elongation factor G [Clostridia bacterium]|nr:elongation factor G [Clostridia bacterium]
MKVYSSDAIRNVALIGHGGEGKTSLAEALLFNAKSIDRLGRVDDGNATMDYDTEEINRKISIGLGVGYAEWKGCKINVLDTPGFFDFVGEVISALHVADGAIIVTSATGQMSVGTEKALEQVAEKKVPAILYVNGVNKENANYIDTVNAIREGGYKKVVFAEIPIIENCKMVGVVSVLEGKAFDANGNEIAIPANIKPTYDEARLAVVEMAAETDDELMMKYFDGEELTHDEIIKGMQAAIADDKVIIAVGGAATANMGVVNLMDNILKFLPAPKADDAAPFVAQVFKSIVDPFVGKMLIFKIKSGKIASGDTIYNSIAEKNEKIGNLFVLKGKKQEVVEKFMAGDIGAVAKLSYTNTGDTICDTNNKVVCDAIPFPSPVISLAVTSTKMEDEEKVIAGLYKLLEEDSTYRVEKNIETSEMLLSGVGETQLEILCKKVKNKFGVEAVLREPRVSYRETIKKTVEQEGKHKKQSGGAGQFGQCSIRFEPGAADGLFEFVDAVVGGSIPRQYIPAVEKGLREAVKRGVLAGYPMVNLKCTVFDGKYHPVDSKEIAFITAAKSAYSDGCIKASPIFLEPIMMVRVIVPESYMGDVLGDMNKRRGRILGMDLVDGKQVINAEVPQGEILRYATDLRSMTQGRGTFTKEFLRYEEVPAGNASKIIEDAKKRAEEEKK